MLVILAIAFEDLQSVACLGAESDVSAKVTLRTLTLLHGRLNSNIDAGDRRLVAEKIIQTGNAIVTSEMKSDRAATLGASLASGVVLTGGERSYVAFWLLRGEASVVVEDETTGRLCAAVLTQLGLDKSDDDRALTLMASMNHLGWLQPKAVQIGDREYVVLTGSATKGDNQHEKYIRASLTRIDDLKRLDTLVVSWVVFRAEHKRKEAATKVDLQIESAAATRHIKLVWIKDAVSLINYLNGGQGRTPNPGCIQGFEYFGCGTKDALWGLGLGDKAGRLDETTIAKIDSRVLEPRAYCQSWANQTAELLSVRWRNHFGVWLVGAIGDVDYEGLSSRSGQVGLSPGSHWKQRP